MKWQILQSDYSFICPWLKVRKDHVKLPNGTELDDFYVVELPDWVNVIAITDDDFFVLEKQYRHGVGLVGYELPAGCVEEGETPLEAAKRELLEETGYAGGEWMKYGRYAPNASGNNNFCYAFIARGVRKMGDQKFDISEDIQVQLKTRQEIQEIMINGQMVEAVMLAPLWRFIFVC